MVVLRCVHTDSPKLIIVPRKLKQMSLISLGDKGGFSLKGTDTKTENDKTAAVDNSIGVSV